MRLFEIEITNGIVNNSSFTLMKRSWNNMLKKKPVGVLGYIADRFKLYMIEDVEYGTPRMFIAALDTKERRYAAFFQLEHFWQAAPNCFGVTLIVVSKTYRGLNIPVQMYKFMIENENLIIVSDDTQSLGGRLIWEKLAKEPGIQVHGFNTRTKKVFQVDSSNLFNEDIYDDEIENEINYLDQEEQSISNSKNPLDIKRIDQIEKERNKLEKFVKEIQCDIRLFAAKAK